MKTQVEGRPPEASLPWFKEAPPAELERLLQAAMQNVERGLSNMVSHPISITAPRLETVPIAQLATYIGDPEAETVGVYLLLTGDLQGQAILLLPLDSALDLAGMILDTPPGTRTLGELERGALAEVGNLMVSYFLNAMAELLDRPAPLYPSPPAVMVDMLGAMLNVIVTPVAAVSDHLLIVTCDLHTRTSVDEGPDENIPIHFWVVPDPVAQTQEWQGGDGG